MSPVAIVVIHLPVQDCVDLRQRLRCWQRSRVTRYARCTAALHGTTYHLATLNEPEPDDVVRVLRPPAFLATRMTTPTTPQRKRTMPLVGGQTEHYFSVVHTFTAAPRRLPLQHAAPLAVAAHAACLPTGHRWREHTRTRVRTRYAGARYLVPFVACGTGGRTDPTTSYRQPCAAYYRLHHTTSITAHAADGRWRSRVQFSYSGFCCSYS